ncbi:MAG TPA: SGNH/GDSL hydrolase family protein [Candidatus Binatia bacterium]
MNASTARRPSARRGASRAAKLAALGVSLLISLYLVELALRVFFVVPWQVTSRQPLGLGVAESELRLAQAEYDVRLRYNSSGFRDEEFPETKEPGELRVLVLGDSFAEGVGVEQDDRFADLLERDLARDRETPVTVIAAGQMATGPASYLRNLYEFGVALRPDVVVITIYVGNDFGAGGTSPARDAKVVETLPPDSLAARGSWRSVVQLEYVRALLRQLVSGETLLHRRPTRSSPWEIGHGHPLSREFFVELAKRSGIGEAELERAVAQMDPELVADFYAGRLNPSFLLSAVVQKLAAKSGAARGGKSKSAIAQLVRQVVDQMVQAQELLARRGIELLVVVVPDVREVQRRDHDRFLARLAMRPSPEMRRSAAVRQRFVRALREKGIAFVDLTRALRAAGAPTFHVMDGHFNELGHRIAADEIGRRLAAAGAN